MSTKLGCKDIEIRKSELFVKTEFYSVKKGEIQNKLFLPKSLIFQSVYFNNNPNEKTTFFQLKNFSRKRRGGHFKHEFELNVRTYLSLIPVRMLNIVNRIRGANIWKTQRGITIPKLQNKIEGTVHQ